MASLCSADVDVVINIAGADSVVQEQALAVKSVLEVSTMDNSDLFVAMCLPGTFSPDTGGVCHDCVKCVANQYEKLACIPTRDRTCANCTVCGTHEIELCQCAIKTSQCVTGDRVCLKVPPTVVNLVVDFTSNGVLSAKQQTFVRSGLAVGYTDWLAMQFNVNTDSVELVDFVRTGTLTYKAFFRFNEVYGQATISNIQGQQQEFFQGGILYTFGGGGGRRRLLQVIPVNYVSVNGVESSCNVNQTCTEAFTEFRFDENSTCTGKCWPMPCPPGYSGSLKNCQLCQPGTFKAEAAFADCTECPAGSTSPIGANSSDACVALETTPALPLPTTTAAGTSSQSQTTAAEGQGSSGTSPGVPSPSQQSTSPPPSSSPSAPTSSSRPYSSPSPATQAPSTAQPAAPPASSSQPSAGSSPAAQQTTPAPPPQPPPPSPASPSAGTGGSSSSNVNTNNVNVNVQPAPVNVNVQPAPVNVNVNVNSPPPPPPPAVQPLQPIFNNYYTLQAPPQSMPDYHRHYHDEPDDAVGGLGMVWLLLAFFALVVGLATCIYTPGCPCAGCCSRDDDEYVRVRRPIIRYTLVPTATPDRGV
jgi:hypothetical protein